MDSSEDLNRGDAAQPAGKAPAKAPRRGKRKDYAVGYCKPPVEHRFAKGKSGNPSGKRRKVELVQGAEAAHDGRSLREMLEAEALRPVRLRSGGRTDELPLIQAAFREVGLKAAKGNRLALSTLAQWFVKLGLDARDEPEPVDIATILEASRARLDAAEAEGAETAAYAPDAQRTESSAEDEMRLRVEQESALRVEEEVAHRVAEEVQRRIAEEVEQRVEAEVQQRMAEVEEALAYKRIWQAAIDVAERIGFAMEGPAPHPDEVVIDTENRCVTYAVPPPPGRGATLANVQAGLAALKAQAALYQLHLSRAVTDEGEAISRGRRDGALKLCGVIEGLLAKEVRLGPAEQAGRTVP